MANFDHIVSLGYNCEVSFRIEEYQQSKLESYIFSWAYILKPEQYFLKSLKHLDDILNHKITIMENGMFKDEKYQIAFHGKTPINQLINAEGNEIEENVNIAIKELKDRIRYLGNKFQNLLDSGDKTLFVMKVRCLNNKKDTIKYIQAIYRFLEKKYISRRFVLLIIIDNEDYKIELEKLVCERLKIGVVSYFAPDEDTKEGSDKEAWKKILNEIINYY